MSTRKWTRYHDLGAEAYRNGRPVTHAKDLSLINCCIANYAEARRNVIAMPINVGILHQGLTGEDPGGKVLLSVPVAGLLRGYGNAMLPVVVNIYAKTTSEVAQNTVYVSATIGNNRGETTIADASPRWIAINVPIRDILGEGDSLTIRARTYGANEIYIYGISVYQASATPSAWVDYVTPDFVGNDDRPCSSAVYNIIRSQYTHARMALIPASNVLHHWFGASYTASGAYQVLRRYKIVKRRGVSTMRVGVLYGTLNGAVGTAKLRTTFNGVSQEDTLSGVAVPTWAWLTDFDMAGGDIDSEVIGEIILEGKDYSGTSGGPAVYLMAVIEDIGAEQPHTIPDPEDVKPRSVIKASTIKNAVNTNDAVRNVVSRQIVMQDWCWDGTGTGTMNCTASTILKYGTLANGVICRALAYPAKGSKKYVVNFGYKITPGNSETKLFAAYVTDDVSDIDVFDSCGPGPNYGTGTGRPKGAVVLSADEDSSVAQESSMTFELDIPSSHWNDDGDFPLWVFVVASTTGSSEYIMPLYLTIHEAPLGWDEFP